MPHVRMRPNFANGSPYTSGPERHFSTRPAPTAGRPASWGQRVAGSLAGSVVGAALFVLTLCSLWWNEQSSVRAIKALLEAKRVLVEAGCAHDAQLNGRLVHVSCPITHVPTLEDADFGVRSQTLGLRRRVEVYQWREHEHKRCWKDDPNAQHETCETTYSYEREWQDAYTPSHNFREPHGHSNPPWTVHSTWQRAPDVYAGEYLLPANLANRLSREVPLPFADPGRACAGWASDHEQDGAGSAPRCPWSSTGSGLYFRAGGGGGLGSQPSVGDARVSWSRVVADHVSVVALQQRSAGGGASLAPFTARNGRAVQLFSEGMLSAESMLAASEAQNRFWTWALRALLAFINWTAICWVFRPLAVAVDVIPFVGSFLSDIASLGISLTALLTSTLVCSLTIAVAWIAVRPEVALPLLVIALGSGGSLAYAREKARTQRSSCGAPTAK